MRRWRSRFLATMTMLLAAGVVQGATAASAPDLLPGEVRGVTGSGDSLSLQLKTADGAERSLKPGDAYRDGWVLKALTPTAATLAREGQERQVGLNPTLAASPADEAATKVTVLSGPTTLRLASDRMRGDLQVMNDALARMNADPAAPRAQADLADAIAQLAASQAVMYAEALAARDRAIAGGADPASIAVLPPPPPAPLPPPPPAQQGPAGASRTPPTAP